MSVFNSCRKIHPNPSNWSDYSLYEYNWTSSNAPYTDPTDRHALDRPTGLSSSCWAYDTNQFPIPFDGSGISSNWIRNNNHIGGDYWGNGTGYLGISGDVRLDMQVNGPSKGDTMFPNLFNNGQHGWVYLGNDTFLGCGHWLADFDYGFEQWRQAEFTDSNGNNIVIELDTTTAVTGPKLEDKDPSSPLYELAQLAFNDQILIKSKDPVPAGIKASNVIWPWTQNRNENIIIDGGLALIYCAPQAGFVIKCAQFYKGDDTNAPPKMILPVSPLLCCSEDPGSQTTYAQFVGDSGTNVFAYHPTHGWVLFGKWAGGTRIQRATFDYAEQAYANLGYNFSHLHFLTDQEKQECKSYHEIPSLNQTLSTPGTVSIPMSNQENTGIHVGVKVTDGVNTVEALKVARNGNAQAPVYIVEPQVIAKAWGNSATPNLPSSFLTDEVTYAGENMTFAATWDAGTYGPFTIEEWEWTMDNGNGVFIEVDGTQNLKTIIVPDNPGRTLKLEHRVFNDGGSINRTLTWEIEEYTAPVFPSTPEIIISPAAPINNETVTATDVTMTNPGYPPFSSSYLEISMTDADGPLQLGNTYTPNSGAGSLFAVAANFPPQFNIPGNSASQSYFLLSSEPGTSEPGTAVTNTFTKWVDGFPFTGGQTVFYDVNDTDNAGSIHTELAAAGIDRIQAKITWSPLPRARIGLRNAATGDYDWSGSEKFKFKLVDLTVIPENMGTIVVDPADFPDSSVSATLENGSYFPIFGDVLTGETGQGLRYDGITNAQHLSLKVWQTT